MRKSLIALGVSAALGLVSAQAATASPFTVDVTATIFASGGSYAGDLDPGVAMTASFSLSTTAAAVTPGICSASSSTAARYPWISGQSG